MDGKLLTSILERLMKTNPNSRIKITWKESSTDDSDSLIIKRRGNRILVIVIR